MAELKQGIFAEYFYSLHSSNFFSKPSKVDKNAPSFRTHSSHVLTNILEIDKGWYGIFWFQTSVISVQLWCLLVVLFYTDLHWFTLCIVVGVAQEGDATLILVMDILGSNVNVLFYCILKNSCPTINTNTINTNTTFPAINTKLMWVSFMLCESILLLINTSLLS